MPKTTYVNIYESNDININKLQTEIIRAVDYWAHLNRRPIPLKEILDRMTDQGIKEQTTVKAIKQLLLKGYIRKAITPSDRRASYVQLRRV